MATAANKSMGPAFKSSLALFLTGAKKRDATARRNGDDVKGIGKDAMPLSVWVAICREMWKWDGSGGAAGARPGAQSTKKNYKRALFCQLFWKPAPAPSYPDLPRRPRPSTRMPVPSHLVPSSHR